MIRQAVGMECAKEVGSFCPFDDDVQHQRIHGRRQFRGVSSSVERPSNIALQLASRGLVLARLRARRHLAVPLAAERGVRRRGIHGGHQRQL